MKRVIAVLLALGALASAPAAQPAATQDLRLVLLIAVDQFRYDYLTRFRSDYADGFKRLMAEGAMFTDANLEHYPTVTAVGHATMLSGATPSVSGIIGNDWFDRASGASVTSVSDPEVTLLGAPSGTGTAAAAAAGASPHRLLVSTVGDEMKMASRSPKGSSGAPRVLGLSLKDRSAIMPVGRGADAAYWWDTKTGNFVTSTYYMREEPPWVRAFNDQKAPDTYAGRAWTLLARPATSVKQLPADRTAALYDGIYGSPFGNDLLASFADSALTAEQLGQRGATDLLSVSFSSNDSVGHTLGPDSPEVRDIAIKTDRAIGRLLSRVDRLVGLQHVLVVLTADHGVAPVPEVAKQMGLNAGRMTSNDLFGPIQKALETKYGQGKWVLSTAGSSPYLNYDLMATLRLDPAEVRRTAAEAAMAVPHVARVFTRDQLLGGDVATDRISQRVLRGFNAQRSGDLEILLEPYWMRQATGTTHGTPYNYDAHIPLILMGAPIKAGEYSDHVALNDLAPTIATLVGVEIPGGSSGRVLTEALRPRVAAPAAVRQPR
jgi:predicted AlkP superfamily pyrophosphatase or phosphodiesterase